MTNTFLSELSPREFFYWFGIISDIPRGSQREGQFISFLQEFAQERNLYCDVDETGNVFMRIPATYGYEKEPAILFQAHMDMVWVKEEGLDFDFEHEPIRMEVREDLLVAKGTTLGSDNGVGLATMLAVADSDSIPHPPLEYLFTTAEEIGLIGIRKFDYGKISARRMINMDCGDSHVLAVSSAGSAKMEIHEDFPATIVSEENGSSSGLTLRVSGCTGGHSGLQIHRGGACAANVLGSLLTGIGGKGYRLTRISSAEKGILKWCEADILIRTEDRRAVEDVLNEQFEIIRKAFAATDPDMTLDISETSGAARALTEEDSERIALLLVLLQTGPYKTNPEDHSIVIASGSLGRIVLDDGCFSLRFDIRDSEDSDKAMRVMRYKKLAAFLGVDLKLVDAYTGWPEKSNSLFRERFIHVHEQLFGYPPELERVHGGIEVGMITGAIPEMDAVGVAPTSRGAHTTEERLYISEVAPYWELMKAVLAERG